MKHLARLTHFTRNAKNNPREIKAGAALPPREIFAEHPAVLTEYDTMATLNAGVLEHHRNSRQKTAAAEVAGADYRAQVKACLAEGKDPSKIKNLEPLLRAEAEAHTGFADDASRQAANQGRVLGAAIKGVATDCFPAAEDKLDRAASDAQAAITALEGALNAWADAYSLRLYLSNAHHVGGSNGAWRKGRVPVEAVEAIAALTGTLGSIDGLKAEEAELNRWREQEANALRTQADHASAHQAYVASRSASVQ